MENLQCGQKVLGTFYSVNMTTFLWAPLTGLLFPVAFSQGLRRLWPPLLKTSAFQVARFPSPVKFDSQPSNLNTNPQHSFSPMKFDHYLCVQLCINSCTNTQVGVCKPVIMLHCQLFRGSPFLGNTSQIEKQVSNSVSSLPFHLTSLRNEKAQFKVAVTRYMNTDC